MAKTLPAAQSESAATYKKGLKQGQTIVETLLTRFLINVFYSFFQQYTLQSVDTISTEKKGLSKEDRTLADVSTSNC